MIRYDTLYKLLVVGDSGVGKTSLIRRFVSDEFSGEFLTTIVIDFQMKVVQLEGKRAKLQIWCVSGQEYAAKRGKTRLRDPACEFSQPCPHI